jgi:hypothetical protein
MPSQFSADRAVPGCGQLVRVSLLADETVDCFRRLNFQILLLIPATKLSDLDCLG